MQISLKHQCGVATLAATTSNPGSDLYAVILGDSLAQLISGPLRLDTEPYLDRKTDSATA